ncbi:tRNA modification GTPase MnmE [Lacipirellula limnantheis]|uniref:tRNA modification GTPase MnmE n=1 Tax=Lacipirellula limnantheis TaxID=2528024 RepID=A0A517U6C2_9BACT|nr:tRNA modification GTPase MnmE [Lacipirellula limnantheis]
MSGPVPARASLLTPVGRGAIAVVAAEGDAARTAIDASFVAANGRPILQQPPDRIAFGHWVCGAHREEVIVIRDDDGGVEVHCHGGVTAAERILTAFAGAGCEVELWPERLDRTAASKIEAEADLALARATTRRTAAILLAQRAGTLSREVSGIRGDLASSRLAAARDRIDALLARAQVGLHLTEPWRIAIAGRPNVGKSSLINALVGYQRAIVFDQPGTTRDVLTADTAIDGWPVRLVDAAGIRETEDELEAEGVRRARQQLATADLVLWVLDAWELTGDPQAVMKQEWREAHGPTAASSLILTVVNKADLLPGDASQPPTDGVQFVSARTGERLAELIELIGRRLVPAASADEAIPFTRRQIELLSAAHASVVAGRANDATAVLWKF